MARKRKRAKISSDVDAQAIRPEKVDSTNQAEAIEKTSIAKKPAAKSTPPKATPKATPSGGKINTFFRDVIAEAKKVSWPDAQKTSQSTGVVIATLFILGLCMTFFTVIFTKITAYLYAIPE